MSDTFAYTRRMSELSRFPMQEEAMIVVEVVVENEDENEGDKIRSILGDIIVKVGALSI
jgi:hypothetical protein